MFNHFKRLANQIVFYGLSDTINRIIAVLILPIFTRYLSPTDYGVSSLLLVMNSLIVSFSDFGLNASVIRFYKDADEAKRKQIVSTAQLAMVLSVTALALLAIPFGRQISQFLFHTPNYAYIVTLNFLTIPLTKLVAAPMLRFRVQEKAKVFAFWEVLQVTGMLAANFIFVVGLRHGVNGLFEGAFLNACLFAVIFAIYSIKNIGFHFSKELFKNMFAFGSPLILNAVSMWIINWADRFILSRLAPLSEVGLYTLGYSIGMGIALPVTAFTAAWPPFYMAISHEKNAKKVYSMIFTFYTLVISFFVLLIGVLGRDYFLFFTDQKFHGAALVVPIVALAYAFRGQFSIAAAGAYLAKKTYLVTVVELISMAVNIVLVYVLVRLMGRVGAAWATAISFALLPVLMLVLTRKVFQLKLEYNRLAQIIIISVLYYYLIHLIYQPTWQNFIVRIILLLLYPVIFWLFGFFRPDELQRIANIKNEFLSRFKIFRGKPLPTDDLGFKE